MILIFRGENVETVESANQSSVIDAILNIVLRDKMICMAGSYLVLEGFGKSCAYIYRDFWVKLFESLIGVSDS